MQCPVPHLTPRRAALPLEAWVQPHPTTTMSMTAVAVGETNTPARSLARSDLRPVCVCGLWGPGAGPTVGSLLAVCVVRAGDNTVSTNKIVRCRGPVERHVT